MITDYRLNLLIATILWAITMYWWYPFEFINTSTWRAGIFLASGVIGAFLIWNFLVGFVRGLIKI